MAFSSNKLTEAIFPICAEFLDEQLRLQKGAIVFISEDKKHDFQQVETFEKRMFEILRMKCADEIKNWLRFSNGCAAQFTSRNVIGKL